MKAVIYARISRDEQSKYSIGEQVELCQKKIIESGHEVADVFIDEGYSSKTMKRPALQSMLSQIKTKRFGIIYVWNSDRLTRTVLDGLIMVTTMFRPNGIEFVSYTEDIDTSTPDGMMMFTIRLSMAQRERERIAERSVMGQTARARRGLRNSSHRPLGYKVGENLSLVILDEEAELVKRIFDLFLAGNGIQKIARTLNEEGIPSKNNGKWYERTIVNVLTNHSYYGATHYKPKDAPEEDRIIVEGMHEPIITKERFQEVQYMIKRRQEQYMSTSSYDFPFSTIVKCGNCGRSYHGYDQKYKKVTYNTRHYRCAGRYSSERFCGGSDISEPKLVATFFDFLNTEFYTTTQDPVKPVEGQDIEKNRKRLEKLISESATKRKNYTRAMGSGKIDYTTFEELIDEENQKSEAWEAELLAISQVKTNQLTKKDVLSAIDNIRFNWPRWDNKERKTAVQQLFEILVIKKTGNTWAVTNYILAGKS